MYESVVNNTVLSSLRINDKILLKPTISLSFGRIVLKVRMSSGSDTVFCVRGILLSLSLQIIQGLASVYFHRSIREFVLLRDYHAESVNHGDSNPRN